MQTLQGRTIESPEHKAEHRRTKHSLQSLLTEWKSSFVESWGEAEKLTRNMTNWFGQATIDDLWANSHCSLFFVFVLGNIAIHSFVIASIKSLLSCRRGSRGTFHCVKILFRLICHHAPVMRIHWSWLSEEHIYQKSALVVDMVSCLAGVSPFSHHLISCRNKYRPHFFNNLLFKQI